MLSKWLPGRKGEDRKSPQDIEPTGRTERDAEASAIPESGPILDDDVIQKLIGLSPDGGMRSSSRSLRPTSPAAWTT
jgi:hypothetical protein